ncbi:MAG: hypothetical protein WBH04_09075 [Albidovulum sp.]
MAEDDGRRLWFRDEKAALTEALRRIDAAASAEDDTHDRADLGALTALPPEIAGRSDLRRRRLGWRSAGGNKIAALLRYPALAEERAVWLGFRGTPAPLAQRLAAARPAGREAQGGPIEASNPSAPQRLTPQALHHRKAIA